jgi:hypothetical protein
VNFSHSKCVCAQRDQQISGASFQESNLYAPVLKSTEARLLLALAVANSAKVIKTDTAIWETTQYTSDRLTGGQSLFWKDMNSSNERARRLPS